MAVIVGLAFILGGLTLVYIAVEDGGLVGWILGLYFLAMGYFVWQSDD